MIMAVRGRGQVLRGRNNELKGCDAASRVVPGEQKAYGQRPYADGFVRRIDVKTGGLLRHMVRFFKVPQHLPIMKSILSVVLTCASVSAAEESPWALPIELIELSESTRREIRTYDQGVVSEADDAVWRGVAADSHSKLRGPLSH